LKSARFKTVSPNASRFSFDSSVFSGPEARVVAEAVAHGQTPRDFEPHFPPGSDEAAGQALFAQACAPCHGGPTQTHALLAGSPAINAGSNAAASAAGLTTDQRGFGPRTAGDLTDLGAFEVGAVPPVPPARAIVAALVNRKVGKRRRVFVRVSFADTGAVQSEVLSPFQKSAFRRIVAAAFDSNGDGVADSVLLSAKRGKKTLTRLLTV
jgi:hypothetical protein